MTTLPINPDTAAFDMPPETLWSLIGAPDSPVVIDVRTDEDYALDPRLVPSSIRRPGLKAQDWAPEFPGKRVVVFCEKGLKISQGAAAWLRHAGADAASVGAGFAGWRDTGLPLVPADSLPGRDGAGRTVWVTRARPKIDRIACPWLIRRFVDPGAVFLFVSAAEVLAVAERFGATPFDVEGVTWSHNGPKCTFDTMLEAFGLETPALARLATIVRGADTGRPDLAPEAAGLLAVSLGLSRMYDDDLAQMEAGLSVYDALYRWSRDAVAETHNWPAAKAKSTSR